MARSLSTAQINSLGNRLRRSQQPTASDLAMLQQLRADYDVPLAFAEDRLRQNGFRPTSRLKTVGTILEKLRRDRTRLSKMQDIAGARILVGFIEEQDDAVDVVVRLFADATVVDRRARPSNGYRAVHVIARVDACPVEIQIRTKMQDNCAQLIEKVADAIGRQIRYGEAPDDPDALLGAKSQRYWVETLVKYAALTADIENAWARGEFQVSGRLLEEANALLESLNP